MNLAFNSLVLIPSDHCNITCRHCAPECGPKLKQPWNVELLKTCITDARMIPGLHRRVHFAGGEPFLYFDQMAQVAEHAYSSGFTTSVVTNGFWARNHGRATAMFTRLLRAGLCRVELSTDVFHQEHLPMQVIRDAVQLLKELGISITLRIVTTRLHTVDKTLRQLRPEDLDGVEVVGSPAVPMGRALSAIKSDEFYQSKNGMTGVCETLLNLTIRSDGSVFPCCSGSEENPSLSLGNVRQFPLHTIVQNADVNLMIKRLVHSGPASFFELLRAVGLGHKIREEYTNICHLCTAFFSDPKIVNAIKGAMSVEEQNLVADVLGPCLVAA